jgi:glyoxylase-like metal-dependent hydrolase (beta-lactamase superfamily II)
VIFESFPVGLFQCNCVILGDEATREAVVIDPGDDLDRILEILDHHRLALKLALHTHGHLDHIGASGDLCRERGATARIHAADLPLWRSYPSQAAMFGLPKRDLPEPGGTLRHGDVIEVGSIRLEVVETPGHTPGSVCLSMARHPRDEATPLLFSGDTLFWKGIGRTDLWGGDYRTLMASLRERLFSLPAETIVHPGHGPETCIADERRSNPFLPDILKVR